MWKEFFGKKRKENTTIKDCNVRFSFEEMRKKEKVFFDYGKPLNRGGLEYNCELRVKTYTRITLHKISTSVQGVFTEPQEEYRSVEAPLFTQVFS